ncbi:hypothetical protein NC796_16190, partial [Aliifodinibius sp. S!AR15-10]|uniref:hypothetical protein n=1 Tax=Aliifodinibius sp. S!AR15-10 TaxID=2950437 RepID=UPI0028610665
MHYFSLRTVQVWIFLCCGLLLLNGCSDKDKVRLKEETHIVLLGNNLGSRMMNYGHFETELHTRYPDSSLFIRNMSDPGNTPVFRPHAARDTPWAF